MKYYLGQNTTFLIPRKYFIS